MKKHLRYYFIATAIVVVLLLLNLRKDPNIDINYLDSSGMAQTSADANTLTTNDSTLLSNNPNTSTNDALGSAMKAPKLSQQECANYFNDMQNSVKNDPAYKDYGFWLSEPTTRENLDYYNYSIDQLEEMAFNDDRTAQHVLADLLKNSKRTRAMYWYKQAAMRGYIYSLTSLALLIRDDPLIKKHDKAKPVSQVALAADKQARNVESFAWLLVSERAMGRSVQDALKMHTGYILETEEIERAKVLSEIYLNFLTTERTKLGLGPFKNRPYPVLEIDENILKACMSPKKH